MAILRIAGSDVSEDQCASAVTQPLRQLASSVNNTESGGVEECLTWTGPTLTLDLAGDEIDSLRGVDGFDLGAPIVPDTYELHALNTPFTVTVPEAGR